MKSLLKRAYTGIPGKQHLFNILKTCWNVPEPVFRHLHFTGRFRVDAGRGRSFLLRHYGYMVENEIFWKGLTGGWEKESVKLWLKLAERARVIFDVGANTGVYALAARAVNPTASIVAFEMIEPIYRRLVDNVALNDFDIVCLNTAVSNKDGHAAYYQPLGSDHAYGIGLKDNAFEAGVAVKEVDVDTIILSSVIERHRLSGLDLMKLDVEGHEPEVLEGLGDYLERDRPSILVEVLSQERADRINGLIDGLGYVCFDIDERSGVRRIPVVARSTSLNVLLCSKERAAGIGLR